jgi:hypothetical protein
MRRLLLALLFALTLAHPSHAQARVLPELIEAGFASPDARLPYHAEWAEEGYWLLDEPADAYVADGVGGTVILPPSVITVNNIIDKIVRIVKFIMHNIFSSGSFSITGILNQINDSVVQFVEGIIKAQIKDHIDSFGKMIKTILPVLYQARLVHDFTIFGFNPLDIGKTFFGIIMPIVWVIGLLFIIADVQRVMIMEGGRGIMLNLLAERLIIWVISILIGLNGYPIITEVYRLAGSAFDAICAGGHQSCGVGDGLSDMYYGAGANATSFIIAVLVLVGGIVLLAAGALFFVLRALLSFIIAFFAPLSIGLANIPLLSTITEIWLKMVGSFMGVNLIYAMLGLTMTLINTKLLTPGGETMAVIRMITAIGFGILSAVGMALVLKNSLIVLKLIAKHEITMLKMRALAQVLK